MDAVTSSFVLPVKSRANKIYPPRWYCVTLEAASVSGQRAMNICPTFSSKVIPARSSSASCSTRSTGSAGSLSSVSGNSVGSPLFSALLPLTSESDTLCSDIGSGWTSGIISCADSSVLLKFHNKKTRIPTHMTDKTITAIFRTFFISHFSITILLRCQGQKV